MKNAKIDSNALLDRIALKLEAEAYHQVWMAIADMMCGADECGNASRYSSGYCGLCDLTLNEGKGERK